MQSYKRQNTTSYDLLEESKGTTRGYNPKDETQSLGRAMDKANAWQVGLASEETSTLGLGKEVAQGEPKARTDCTTRDWSRETPSSP